MHHRVSLLEMMILSQVYFLMIQPTETTTLTCNNISTSLSLPGYTSANAYSSGVNSANFPFSQIDGFYKGFRQNWANGAGGPAAAGPAFTTEQNGANPHSDYNCKHPWIGQVLSPELWHENPTCKHYTCNSHFPSQCQGTITPFDQVVAPTCTVSTVGRSPNPYIAGVNRRAGPEPGMADSGRQLLSQPEHQQQQQKQQRQSPFRRSYSSGYSSSSGTAVSPRALIALCSCIFD